MNAFNKIIRYIFQTNIIVATAMIMVYAIIFYYIPNGISCDEGFYLMGYLREQSLGPMVNDFHNIVRFITPEYLHDNVMNYRYIRFVLDFSSALLFAIVSYKWIKQKYEFSFDKTIYISLIMLGASISYTYTTATISFDHLQHIVYLFAFSFFLASNISAQKHLEIIFQFITGCFLVLAITNYLPSGILLLFVFIIFTVITHPNKTAIAKIVLLFISLIMGFLLYHIAINPLDNYLLNVTTSMKVAADGVTRHDSVSLILKMITAIGVFVLVQLPVFIIGLLSRKINVNFKFIVAISVLIIINLVIFRKIYLLQAYLYYIPVSFVLGIFYAQKGLTIKKCNIPNVLLFLMFTFLPFMGVFGTNQSIMSKTLIFMPFWASLFVVILSKLAIDKKKSNIILLVVVALYSLGYLYQGNFRRYHSYYTPRSSKYELSIGERYNKVKVSAYELNYYKTLSDTLKSIGFVKGSTAIAFGEQQIGLYLMGGFFHGPLVYSVNQYVIIPEQKSPYILLFKKEEESVNKQLKNSGWDFPSSYKRIEIGSMAENLDATNHNTVIYYINN